MGKVTAAIIGAGGRGQFSYAPYSLQNPNELEFVAVAEPRDFLRDRFAKTYGIKDELSFNTWEDMLNIGPIADCVIICTHDTMHVSPAVEAIKKGYRHILLEKPIDPNMGECKRLLKIAREYGANVQICHSLRYTPYFRRLKDVLDSGVIGDIINIIHTEGVGYYHHTHSYVRGDWADTTVSSPMIMAKCCHDMDLLVYLTGKNCRSISSYGKLTHFRPEKAPEGSTERCTDGCRVRDKCPYNAAKIYKDRDDFQRLACEKEGYTSLAEALQKGRFGRCVYRCGNNAVDHQTVNMLFDDDITVVLTMSAFSHTIGRTIRIMGTMGEIIGDMEDSRIDIYNFVSGDVDTIKVFHSGAGHSGADEIIMRDFVQMISGNKEGISDLEVSIQSHVMCHAAEVSRTESRIVDLSEFL